MSTLKKELFSLEGGTTAAHLQAILIDMCICYKAGDQKLRPCAFIFFFYDNLLQE